MYIIDMDMDINKVDLTVTSSPSVTFLPSSAGSTRIW